MHKTVNHQRRLSNLHADKKLWTIRTEWGFSYMNWFKKTMFSSRQKLLGPCHNWTPQQMIVTDTESHRLSNAKQNPTCTTKHGQSFFKLRTHFKELRFTWNCCFFVMQRVSRKMQEITAEFGFLLKGQSQRKQGGKLKTHVKVASTVTSAVSLPALAPGSTLHLWRTRAEIKTEWGKKKKDSETLKTFKRQCWELKEPNLAALHLCLSR